MKIDANFLLGFQWGVSAVGLLVALVAVVLFVIVTRKEKGGER